MFFVILFLFLWNTGFAARRVSQRKYGWATGYALTAVLAALLVARLYPAAA